MKNTVFSSLLRRTTALVLAAALLVPTVVYADAGAKRLKTDQMLLPGLTYHNTITERDTRRVESFSLELNPGSIVKPILLQSDGTIYGAATINKAVKNAQSLGYQVLGAINTDFFVTSNGVPLGIVVEDGVYKSSHTSSASNNAMLITDGLVTLNHHPQVNTTLYNSRSGAAVSPSHFNKSRVATGGIYLLNHDFSTVSTRTSGSGWFVRMQLDDPTAQLTVNSSLSLHVTEVVKSDGSLKIAPNEYILTCDDRAGLSEVFQSFQVGDQITLQTSTSDPALSAAQWAGGVGDVMIQNGVLTDPNSWTYNKSGRAPRTALGVKPDGTLLLYAVDGRQQNHSAGLSQLDLAEELLAQGCQWAVNLDGGGSTTISVCLPGQPNSSIINRPSDGKARSCATFLLLVTDQKGDGQPARLIPSEDGAAVFAGSSMTLPSIRMVDNVMTPLGQAPDDVIYSSENGLGLIQNGVYTAWGTPGTDTIRLYSPSTGLEGSFQIHVVDALTSLEVYTTQSESHAPLTALSGKPGVPIQLGVSGSYWNRLALRDTAPVTWSVAGNIGTMSPDGLFTPSGAASSGTITAVVGGQSKSIPFSAVNVHLDVPPGHWAYDAVEYCYQHHIVRGVNNTQFGPDLTVQRADFIVMLHNAMGSPAPKSPCTFTDVTKQDYYYDALSWAQSVGLATGSGDGRFMPRDKITREQAFSILYRAMPLLGKAIPDASLTVLDAFTDKSQISDYAKLPTATLAAQKLVSGSAGKVMPKDNMTRAAAAALFHNVMEHTPIIDVPTDPNKPVEPEVPVDPVEPEVPVDPEVPDIPVEGSMTVSPVSLELGSAGLSVLTASNVPADAKLTWSSSDPTCAAVTPDGVVTNLNAEAEPVAVTITAAAGGQSASTTVICQPPALAGVVHDAQAGLRVRSGPGKGYALVGALQNGTRVVVLEEVNGWYHILFLNEHKQATSGYVSSDYMNLIK